MASLSQVESHNNRIIDLDAGCESVIGCSVSHFILRCLRLKNHLLGEGVPRRKAREAAGVRYPIRPGTGLAHRLLLPPLTTGVG